MDRFASLVYAVTDCMKRISDGIESRSWRYVLDQVHRCSMQLAEIGFEADKLLLLEEKEAK